MAMNNEMSNQKKELKQMNASAKKPNGRKKKTPSKSVVGANNSKKASVYRTQGIITSINLMGKSFAIDPISPYVFEQKEGNGTVKNTLFVLADDKDSSFKDAKILTCKPDFEIPKKIDLGAIIALKNAREKIELVAELDVGFIEGKDKLKVKTLNTLIA